MDTVKTSRLTVKTGICMLITAVLMLAISYMGFCKADTSYTISENSIKTEKDRYKIEFKYPQMSGFKNSTGQAAFNAKIKTFVDNRVRKFTSDFIENDNPQTPPWGLYYEYEIKYSSDNLISVVLEGSEYCGGAHPNPEFRTILFNLNDGKEKTLASLFKQNTGYLKKISEITVNDLKKRENSEHFWLEEGAAAKSENFRYFYLTKNNLVMIIPPYQVAPYAMGTYKVPIAFKRIKEIIDHKGPIGDIPGAKIRQSQKP
jgi:hypothetical protein